MKPLLLLALLLTQQAGAAAYDADYAEEESTEAAGADSAREEAPRVGVFLGGGFFFENMLKVSSTDAGSRSLLGEAYFPELKMGYRFGNWFPLLGYTPLGNRSGEGNKRRGLVRLQMPYVFFPVGYSGWEWKAGPGILIHRIYGEGGGVALRNGGQAKVYYTPTGTSTTRLLYVTGGAAYVEENWRYDVDLIVTGILSTRRAFSLSFGAGYVF